MSNYDREYDRMARRRRTQRKSIITTVIAGVIIIAAVIAIIIVILSLLKSSSTQQSTAAATEATAPQPTLYQSTEPSAEATTQPTSSTQPTESPSSVAPTEPSSSEQTEPPYEEPTEPDVQPTEPAVSGSSYTDDSGVLHVFTPSGYNWTYYSDGVSVKITCQPHYDIGQYEFLITGLIPGDTEFNVYYYTDEAQKNFVKVPVTANVDADLRVTRTN